VLPTDAELGSCLLILQPVRHAHNMARWWVQTAQPQLHHVQATVRWLQAVALCHALPAVTAGLLKAMMDRRGYRLLLLSQRLLLNCLQSRPVQARAHRIRIHTYI
jgi:hypothetical protein